MSLQTILYAVAIFLGSFLLFLIEPIAGKRLLPLLGGSSAVWITCLVFFQVALLLGYSCAHWLATRLRPRAQAAVYGMLLLAGLAQGAFSVRPILHASTFHPIASVFVVLTALIGLPFLVLSATNPLLQAWYARAFAESRGEAGLTPPYRLFALSNFGSLLALLLYPWLVEPRFTLQAQSLVWMAGFVLLTIACACVIGLGPARKRMVSDAPLQAPDAVQSARPGAYDRLLWLLLPACGSLLLCAVTNHLSQNIAAIPLLWILPLTAYLLSFVVAFSQGKWSPRLLAKKLPVLGISVARLWLFGLTAIMLGSVGRMLYDTRTDLPLRISIILYCVALFITCLFCHAELHRLRPAPAHATAFYLSIAAGGALGSLFVGVLAPLVFRNYYELVCGLIFTAVMGVAITWRDPIGWRLFWTGMVGAMVWLAFVQVRNYGMDAMLQQRNFYGTLRVTQEFVPPGPNYKRTLFHGTIEHGIQIFSKELRREPTSYYARDSGVGLAMDNCCGDRPRRVGVIGLGTGTMAAYGRKGDVFRFYDINPLVETIARNVFTYLRDTPASVDIVLGDARLSLESEPPQHYDVLVLDAFSGDAIPVHLLTREAFALYRRHLQPGGILAVHVSNKFLRLAPVVAQEAAAAGMQTAYVVNEDDEDLAEYSSDWVLVTNNQEFLANPEIKEAETDITPVPGLRLWTDAYNSLLPVLKKED